LILHITVCSAEGGHCIVILIYQEAGELKVAGGFEAKIGHDLKVVARDVADEQIARRAAALEDDAEKARLRVETPEGVVFPDPGPAWQ
jgi:hypothetical protein